MVVSIAEEVICILTVVLFWGTYIPICFVSMYQYYRQRNELVIINRRGLSSIITCFFLQIMIFLMGFASLAHAEYVVFTLNFCYAFVHLGIYFSILYRFYIIYFDFKWHFAMTINQNWHQIINVTSKLNTNINNNNNGNSHFEWFIDNRSKFGTSNRFAKIFIAIWFIASSVTTALVMIEVFSLYISDLYTTLSFFFLLLLFCYIFVTCLCT